MTDRKGSAARIALGLLLVAVSVGGMVNTRQTTAAPRVAPQAVVTASLPCDPMETQAWWGEDGLTIPSKVGHHVHLGACWPKYGQILDGTLNIDAKVILHALPPGATAAYLRVGYGLDGTIFYKRTSDITIPVDAEGNGSRTFTIPLDLNQVTTGSREFRFTYDVRYTLDGLAREQFNTTGWQGCVRSCASPDRAAPWYEMRGWYGKDKAGITHNYQNVRLRSSTDCLHLGGQCKVEMKPGSGGRPTVQSWAVIDPDFHAGSAGTVLPGFPKPGQFSGTITIPGTLQPGTHKLVLVASDGKDAGAGAFTFEVP